MALVFLATAGAAGATSALGSDPSTWTPGQRATVEKVLKRATVNTHKTTSREQQEQRMKGVPVELSRGLPQYPRYDLDEDVYGCVTVAFEIRQDGKTDQFEVVKAEPAQVFDRLAMGVIMATEFERPAADKAPLRHQKTLFMLLPKPLPTHFSRVNQRSQEILEKARTERRAACEATGMGSVASTPAAF